MTNTIPIGGPAPDYPLPYDNESVGGDNNKDNKGNVNRIMIDFGKSAHTLALCAAFCGLCAAITIVTVWHSKERETETQAQIRVLKNHIDDAYNKLAVIEKLEEKRK